MKEQFVTENIAFALKKAGYDERSYARYFNGELRYCLSDIYEQNSETNAIDMANAPLWQQAIDWLFQKNVIITTDPVSWEFGNIDLIKCSIWNKGECIRVLSNDGSGYFKSPHKAHEQAILKALTLIK